MSSIHSHSQLWTKKEEFTNKATKRRWKSFLPYFSRRKESLKILTCLYVQRVVCVYISLSSASYYHRTCFPFTSFPYDNGTTSRKFLASHRYSLRAPYQRMAFPMNAFQQILAASQFSTNAFSGFSFSLAWKILSRVLFLWPFLIYTNCRLWNWTKSESPSSIFRIQDKLRAQLTRNRRTWNPQNIFDSTLVVGDWCVKQLKAENLSNLTEPVNDQFIFYWFEACLSSIKM